MAITYGFFDSRNGDRFYEALHFNELFNGIITPGIFESVGNKFNVISAGSGMLVLVKDGRAWLNNIWVKNDADYPIYIEEPQSQLMRIDAIVIEVDTNNDERECKIKVVSGPGSASNPQKPTMTRANGVYQYALAYITVNIAASQITDADIEVVVGHEETPYVTGVVDQASVSDIVAGWSNEFERYFAKWKEEQYNEFKNVWMSSIVNELSTSEIGAIQAAILGKETKPVQLTATLGVGDTTLTFTDPAITNTSLINVYSDPYGIRLETSSQINGSITLVFEPAAVNTTIVILVRNP